MEDFRKNLKQRKRKLQSPLDITDTFKFDVVFIDKFNHADYCCYCDRRYNLGRSIEWFFALHWILCERCLSVFKFISDLSEISEGFFLLHCKKKCSENELCLNIFLSHDFETISIYLITLCLRSTTMSVSAFAFAFVYFCCCNFYWALPIVNDWVINEPVMVIQPTQIYTSHTNPIMKSIMPTDRRMSSIQIKITCSHFFRFFRWFKWN